MTQKKFAELKPGDKIILFGETYEIEKIETSGKGIKRGRTKCRIEAKKGDGKKEVFIRLAEETVETK